MSRKTERLTHRHRKLLRNSITQTAYANDAPPASPAEVLSLLDDAAELDAAGADGDKSPLEDAIDKIWRDVVLARKPAYGEWEYGGMAYRHIVAEVRQIEAERDAARDEIAGLKRAYEAEIAARLGGEG